jgi:hypothetical protein
VARLENSTTFVPHNYKKTFAMFEKELQWFINNQNELVQQYNGKHLAIFEQKIVGVYDSFKDACHGTKKNGLTGKAQIQYCIPGEEAYTVHCYNSNPNPLTT